MAQERTLTSDSVQLDKGQSEKGLITAQGGSSPKPMGSGGVGGTTKIADSVVARIAGIAAREVAGVHDMTSTGLVHAFGNITGRVTGQDQQDRGVVVQVGEIECIVDLNIVVDYEASIPQVAMALRRNVSGRIRGMTGLETKEVNINVADLYFPNQDQDQEPQAAVR